MGPGPAELRAMREGLHCPGFVVEDPERTRKEIEEMGESPSRPAPAGLDGGGGNSDS